MPIKRSSLLCVKAHVLLALLVLAASGHGGESAPDTVPGNTIPESLATRAALTRTVHGPALDDRAQLPDRINARELLVQIDTGRPLPDVFWFNRDVRVWYAAQSQPAPLVIVVAGTGGGANTQKNQLLRRALYQAGYHVLTVPSPTFPGFIVGASSTGVAGDLLQDAEDLHRLLAEVLVQLSGRLEIDGLHVVGYSLGGAHAAALKALDQRPDGLGIERVVMINPPVSLFTSISRLDELFSVSIGDQQEDIEALFRWLYSDLVRMYRQSGSLEMDEQFLLEAAARLLEGSREYAAAIALTFRVSLVNMFFAGDYFAGTGVVVDPDDPPTRSSSLEPVLRELRARPFADYMRHVFVPFYLAREPELTEEALIARSHLRVLEPLLSDGSDIFAQHSRDDFILGPDDMTWLKGALGERLKVYPVGGHLGGLGEREQVDDLLRMLEGRWP
ncbi:alpha/beta fold hydrolase [Marinimicrobium alkaliphilum]|uniref:alpha/beta fold hydrolase n=1 Tax=Marinimicrobium alkaliphilum TaxID=2202654 RepID=UPI000DB97C91|nr:alpha/beta hydrolase [Marinimicrobium alkaliphilum]